MPRAVPKEVDTSNLRRSSRAKQNRSYVESDSDSDGDSDEFEDESDNEEYTASASSKKRTASQKKGSASVSRAKRSKSAATKAKALARVRAAVDFEENYLYESLSQPDISVHELSLEWIEAYEQEKLDSITTLTNLLLRCCGCVHLLQPHDLVNLESASETIGEVQIAFESQKSHEYPFISNNKDIRFFKKNVVEFFEELIQLSHEKGILYKGEEDDNDDDNDEDDEEKSLSSHLMTNILTWFSTLSTSTARPLRYVSTVILLTIQSKLCHIIVSLISNQEKNQRQLANYKKQKKSGASSKKKIDTITQTIATYHTQIETINEYFNDIIDSVFVHRYRDIDLLIRQECLKHLGDWMIIYPEQFLQSSHLRYFGWLLSDPQSQVRLEVIKVLLKLYKYSSGGGSSGGNSLSIGFRQFTERFKRQMINMSVKDKDFHVRFSLMSCLCELQKIGFLDESEIVEVSSQFFTIINSSNGISSINTDKLKAEVAKFISIAIIDSYKNILEKYSIHFATLEDETKVEQIKSFIKIRLLIDFLVKSKDAYSAKAVDFKTESENFIHVVFEYLYSLPSFTKSVDSLIQYFFYDFAGLPSDGESGELKELLELDSDEDKFYILSFILGSLTKIRSLKTGEDDEKYETILLKLANHLPNLQQISIRSTYLFKVYLKIWALVVCEEVGNSKVKGIYSVFKELDQVDTFNQLIERLFSYYQDYEPKQENDELIDSYEIILREILLSYDSLQNSSSIMLSENNTGILITPEIRLAIQDLTSALVDETRARLESVFSAASEVEQFQSGGVVQFENLHKLTSPLTKINQIGESINIGKEENAFGITMLTTKLINRIGQLDLEGYLSNSPTSFSENKKALVGSFKSILNFFLTLNSWSLEGLIRVPLGMQSQYDLKEYFKDLGPIIKLQQKLLLSTTASSTKIKGSNELQTLISAKLIDTIISMKIFYGKFQRNSEFRNFQILNDIGSDLFVKRVNREVEDRLLNVFLYKEAVLGTLLGIDLDRKEEEDVNFGDEIEEEIEDDADREASRFEEDDEREDEPIVSDETLKNLKAQEKRNQRIWNAEKDLCVFTMKLFGMIGLSLVDKRCNARIELNSEKIGGLFSKIVKQNQAKLTTIQRSADVSSSGQSVQNSAPPSSSVPTSQAGDAADLNSTENVIDSQEVAV